MGNTYRGGPLQSDGILAPYVPDELMGMDVNDEGIVGTNCVWDEGGSEARAC